MDRIDDLNKFYRLLDELRECQGGFRFLRDCSASTGWPEREVYFFFEPGETRSDGKELRVTRVRTDAVSEGSKATLWSPRATHRGTSDGGGNRISLALSTNLLRVASHASAKTTRQPGGLLQ